MSDVIQNTGGMMIVIIVLASVAGTAVRRRIHGKPLLSIDGKVAQATLFDALIISFMIWAVLYFAPIVRDAAHWFILGGLVLVTIDGAVRDHVYKRSSLVIDEDTARLTRPH